MMTRSSQRIAIPAKFRPEIVCEHDKHITDEGEQTSFQRMCRKMDNAERAATTLLNLKTPVLSREPVTTNHRTKSLPPGAQPT
jgi:hypothetical protein